jgi:glycosyltransferase involved in cell wall biosynthesis
MPYVERLSVVIPAFNSAASLDELIDRLTAVLPTCAATSEIILVDDGSADDSWVRVQALSERSPLVRGIALSKNYGQHNALLAGIRAAHCQVVVTMDDDLQHRPEEIPRLLQALGPDIDLVYGQARAEEHGLVRNLASRFSKLAMGLTLGWASASKVSAFRAFRSTLIGAFNDVRDPYVNLDVMLSWSTDRIASITVEMDVRRHGTSNYSSRSLVRHGLNMVTGFSAVPLRMVAWLGFGMAAFGTVLVAYVLGRLLLTGESVPGFPFLASIIAVFAGATLISLGVIGEYLGRMHFRSMGQPAYWVRENVVATHEINLGQMDRIDHHLKAEAEPDPRVLGG